MTHRVHPFSHRLGIIRDWRSRWFGVQGTYQAYLKQDVLLREYLEKVLKGNHISSIEIERGASMLRLIIKTSRPGMIIGRSGEGAAKLRAQVLSFLHKKKMPLENTELKIDIEEVRSPESDAAIVAAMVVEGLEKRLPFRRILKQTAEKVMANRDVIGVRVRLAGRLGGAEMARIESIKKGRIPLQTFRADVDYAVARALLPYDELGVKVWIYRGEVFNKQAQTKHA